PRKTSASGLAFSAWQEARISDSFLLPRKIPRNSRDSRRAPLNVRYLRRMMAQDKTEKTSKISKTIRATGPVVASNCHTSLWYRATRHSKISPANQLPPRDVVHILSVTHPSTPLPVRHCNSNGHRC